MIMNQTDITKLLHHRTPYLMVSSVVKIDSKEVIVTKSHSGLEGHYKGHFPLAPVVPGAMLQEICTQAGGILISKYYSPVENYDSEVTKGHALGVLKKVHYAKYMGIVKPDKEIQAHVKLVDKVDNLFKFSAVVKQANEVKAKISFNLVNISDEHLF